MPLIFKLLKLLLVISIFTGCVTAPNYRSNPQLSEKIETAKRIVLIPLRTDVIN